MGTETLTLWAGANLGACIATMWMCACRLNLMSRTTGWHFRVGYSVLLAGALACGLSPTLWGVYPGPGTAILSTAVALHLALGTAGWAAGAPGYTESGPAPLDALPRREGARHDVR